MRTLLSLLLLALVAPIAGAWGPRIVTDPKEKEALLREWEKGAKPFRDFACRIERTDTDAVYTTEKKYSAEVHGLSSGVLRYLEKDAQGKPLELTLMTPQEIRRFTYEDKTEHIIALVPPYPGMEIAKVVQNHYRRPFFDLLPPLPKDRFVIEEIAVDQHYLYLTLKPPFDKTRRWIGIDPSYFHWMRVAIDNSNWRTRQILIQNIPGSTTRWDILSWAENLTTPLTLKMLSGGLPEGWNKRTFPQK